MSSRRWCRCLRSAAKGDLPARSRRTTASPKSSNGMRSTANGRMIGMNAGNSSPSSREAGLICPVTAIARVAHEQLRRVPVEHEEARAGTDDDDRDERGEVEVVEG